MRVMCHAQLASLPIRNKRGGRLRWNSGTGGGALLRSNGAAGTAVRSSIDRPCTKPREKSTNAEFIIFPFFYERNLFCKIIFL